MPKHVFFDLDDTLTPSRAGMHPAHTGLFEALCDAADVIVVTGGAAEQIQRQLPLAPQGHYFQLSQQGNFAVHKDGTELWRESVTGVQEAVVKPFAQNLTAEYLAEHGKTLRDLNDIFENRGSQFASSIIGFHAPAQEKYAADPDQSIRRSLLARHAEEIEALHNIGIDVMPAGTTTFDFILLGKNKGYNIRRLIEHEGWADEECLYLGDALFKGGNDESVIGIIPTHPVKNPDDTFNFIKQMLS